MRLEEIQQSRSDLLNLIKLGYAVAKCKKNLTDWDLSFRSAFKSRRFTLALIENKSSRLLWKWDDFDVGAIAPAVSTDD